MPPPLADQLGLNQLLLLLKTFFFLLPWGVLSFWLTLFHPFCRYKIVKEEPTKGVFCVVHVFGGKKYDIYIMQRLSFLHPKENVNWELLKLWEAPSLPSVIRLTLKMVDFVMGRKQAISKTEDAVLKVRYQGTEKNFKFLFGLLCCASRKSPFSPLNPSFLPILSVFLVTSTFIVWCVFLLAHKLRVAHWIFAVKM